MVTVKVEEAFWVGVGVAEVGLKLHPTVECDVEQVRLMAELKLFEEVSVMVEGVEFPGFTCPDVGEAAIVKSGAAGVSAVAGGVEGSLTLFAASRARTL